MNKKLIPFIAGIPVIILLGIGFFVFKKETPTQAPNVTPREELKKTTATPKDTFNSCSQDSDCVITQSGPCTCTSGGSNIAVNKKFVTEWEELQNSQGVMCIQMISNDWTCQPETIARCIQNICQLEGVDNPSDSKIQPLED